MAAPIIVYTTHTVGPVTNDVVGLSTDGGATFHTAYEAAGEAGPGAFSIYLGQDVALDGDQTIIDVGGRIITSNDLGATWNVTFDPGFQGAPNFFPRMVLAQGDQVTSAGAPPAYTTGTLYANGVFITVGEYHAAGDATREGVILVSSDKGQTWGIHQTVGINYAVAFSPTLNRFVVAGLGGTISAQVAGIYYSDDNGGTWTFVAFAGVFSTITSLVWARDRFVGLSDAGYVSRSSTTGLSWTEVHGGTDVGNPIQPAVGLPGGGVALLGMHYDSQLDLISVMGGGTPFGPDGWWTSAGNDGHTWTLRIDESVFPVSETVRDNNATYWADGAAGALEHSTDGKTWTLESHALQYDLYQWFFSGTYYVAYFYDYASGDIWLANSTDRLNWTPQFGVGAAYSAPLFKGFGGPMAVPIAGCVPFEVQTASALLDEGRLALLQRVYIDINCAGETLTPTILVDNVDYTQATITNAARSTIEIDFQKSGREYAVRLTGCVNHRVEFFGCDKDIALGDPPQ